MSRTFQEAQGRVIWADICRIVCIFSVLIQLSIFLPEGYFSPWHGIIMGPSYDMTRPIVPVLVFFFLSGWFQNPKSRYFEWRKVLFFFLPVIVFWNLMQVAANLDLLHNWKSVLMRIGIWQRYPLNEPLWFLIELAGYTLLLPLIHRIPFYFRISLIVILLWLGNCHYDRATWGFSHYANNISFFFAGTVAKNMNQAAVCDFFKKTAIWFVPVTVYLFYHPFISFLPSYSLPATVVNNALTPVVGLMSIFGVSIMLEKLVPKFAWKLAQYAPAVFFLYVSHWPVFTAYADFASYFEIPPLPPLIMPLAHIIFMVAGIAIWKLGIRIPCQWVRTIVFVYPYKLPQKGL